MQLLYMNIMQIAENQCNYFLKQKSPVSQQGFFYKIKQNHKSRLHQAIKLHLKEENKGSNYIYIT